MLNKIISLSVLFLLLWGCKDAKQEARQINEELRLCEPLSTVEVDLFTVLDNDVHNSKDSLSEDVILSTILWVTNGVNSSTGKRTTPTSFAINFVNTYLFYGGYMYLYEPVRHSLLKISSSKFDFNKFNACLKGESFEQNSVYMLFAGDLSRLPFFTRLPFVPKYISEDSAFGTVGAMGENLYLICRALNLYPKFCSNMDAAKLQEVISLGKAEIPLYAIQLFQINNS